MESSKDPTKAVEVAIFQKGQEILSEGEEASLFHVILSGQVILSQQGKEIRRLYEQDIFGLEGLLLKKPFHYTAKAARQCRIAKYGPDTLEHLIRESHRMTKNILVSVLQQLNQTSVNMLDLPQAVVSDKERIRFYNDEETIIEDTGRGTDIYRLVSTEGGLRAVSNGRELEGISKPGEFFGFFNWPTNACIKSVGETVVERYGPDDLDVIVRDYPESACRIMRFLIDALRDKCNA